MELPALMKRKRYLIGYQVVYFFIAATLKRNTVMYNIDKEVNKNAVYFGR